MKRNIQNKKPKYLKYLFGVAVIIWMCVIFWFSAQPAVKSAADESDIWEKDMQHFCTGVFKIK